MSCTIACGSVMMTTSFKMFKNIVIRKVSLHLYYLTSGKNLSNFSENLNRKERCDWRSRSPRKCASTRRPSSSACPPGSFSAPLSAVGIAAAMYLWPEGPLRPGGGQLGLHPRSRARGRGGLLQLQRPDPGAVPVGLPQVGVSLRREAGVPLRRSLLPGPGAEGGRGL